MIIYAYTSGLTSVYVYTEPPKPYTIYAYTSKLNTIYAYTEPKKPVKIYAYTSKDKKIYFYTEPRFEGEDIYYSANNCAYPTELERIREKAVLEYYSIIKKSLLSSLNKESYGKACLDGYIKTGSLRVLIDYLSTIWLEKQQDAKSGLVRTTTYYWDKYKLNDILISFRECKINIKPILDLFNLKTYEITDGDWPSYTLITQITNPPNVETTKTLKQFRDIFTNQSITTSVGEAKYALAGSQTSFTTTKPIKYLTSFIISGNDYTGTSVDYTGSTVTYSPSVLFGYGIVTDDTVTITYWYEE